jgi:hypothetical protein
MGRVRPGRGPAGRPVVRKPWLRRSGRVAIANIPARPGPRANSPAALPLRITRTRVVWGCGRSPSRRPPRCRGGGSARHPRSLPELTTSRAPVPSLGGGGRPDRGRHVLTCLVRDVRAAPRGPQRPPAGRPDTAAAPRWPVRALPLRPIHRGLRHVCLPPVRTEGQPASTLKDASLSPAGVGTDVNQGQPRGRHEAA